MVVCKVTFLVLTIVLANVSSHRIRTLAAPVERVIIVSLNDAKWKSFYQKLESSNQVKTWKGLFNTFSRRTQKKFAKMLKRFTKTRDEDESKNIILTPVEIQQLLDIWEGEFRKQEATPDLTENKEFLKDLFQLSDKVAQGNLKKFIKSVLQNK
eukprot:GHVL01014068.1.p1 GENE.GHVL01014068.1~~GHVL01014068.1.p1  ORF type:complete len:154 (+),score=25.43 GHVL01014068.1:59-520(+)